MRKIPFGLCAAVLALALLFPFSAFAACSSPSGNEGEIIYNSDYHTGQFCNGTNWISMGGGSTGIGTLTNTKWCTTDGSVINCTSDAPAGSPGGSNTYVQFNNSSAFGGDSGFTYAGSGSATLTAAMTAARFVVSGSTAATNGIYLPASNTIGISANSIDAARFNTVASGVNYFNFTPSATGNAITLAPAGSDSNIGVDINAKGTGSVRVTSQAAGAVAFAIKAAASQSGHLQDWQNSSGTALSYVTSGGVFTGDGSGLTSLPAANLTGTIAAISGANVTSLNASNLSSGTVGTARLGSGSATSSTFLRGDGTWAAPTGGAAGDIQTFTASGTWTKPSSGTVTYLRCWGGGGGGGRASGNYAVGAGGGGGSYNDLWIATSSMGSTETVTIGAGGTAATSNNTNGGAGGNTTFGAKLTAYGGGGGGGGSGAQPGGGGGPQGAGGTNTGLAGAPVLIVSGANNGDTNQSGIYHGGGGSDMNANAGGSLYGGGGGGSATYDGVTFSRTTAGPSLFGGAGGAGGASSGAAGTAGTQPGGAGGGAYNANGAAGGAGKCIAITF